MSPPDEGVFAVQLANVREQLADMKAESRRQMERLDGRLDQMQSGVQASLDRLAFVSLREYETNQKADRDYAEETRKIADGARAAAVGVLLCLAGIILAAAIGILVAVAG